MKLSRNLFVCLCLIFLTYLVGYSQTNAVIKNLEKGEYEEAFVKLNSSFKDTNNVERLGLMYQYYADTNNPSYNSCLAYYYANKYNQNKAASKIEIKEFIQQTLSRIHNSESVEKLEEFIECFKEETAYVKEAVRLLEQIAFVNAQKEGSIEAYEEYVGKFPNALQSSLAKQEIDRLVIEDVLESDDLEQLRAFVQTSDNPKYVNQVKLKIEKLVFAQSLEANTADAYLAYLEEYPEGAYGKLAKQKLNDVLYLNATQSGKVTELSKFVKEHTDHPDWNSAFTQLRRKTFVQLSVLGMKTLYEADNNSDLLNRFAQLYLEDTRKSTMDTLLANFPSIATEQYFQKADKNRKSIETLLSKPKIENTDFKSNKKLFTQKGNIQTYDLVEKYLRLNANAKSFDKHIYSSLTTNLQQSKLLPLFVEQREFPEARELKDVQSELVSARTLNGFCVESSLDACDIYRIVTDYSGKIDSVLLPSPVNTRYRETAPLLSSDKKTLFFSSDAGVNHGGLDVYFSHREDAEVWDNWSEPILFGEEINTAYDDAVLEVGEKELVVQSGKSQTKKVYLFEEELQFIDGYLLDQSGRFLKGEILILDSITLDTLYITHSNNKGYFAYLKPEQPYCLHSQMSNHINFFSNDLSQVVVQSIEDLISTKKLFITENPFGNKKRNQLTPKGKRELEYFAQSIKHINYTVTISVHIHTESDAEKAEKISMQQADEITKLLIKNGIPKEKIVIVGYGNTSPLIGWEGKDRIEIGFLNN